MNTQTYFQLIQDWKGTPMEAVIHIMNSENYRDSKEKVIENKIIGEMTPLEKAIFTRLAILEEDMLKQLCATITGGCPSEIASTNCFDCAVYKSKTCPVYQQIHQIHVEWHKDTTPLKAILAKLIYDRFGVNTSLVAQGFLLLSQDKEFESSYKESERTSNTEKTKAVETLLGESIHGTFLETIVDMMESETFVDSDVPVGEGQAIISDLKSFEQALFSLMIQQQAETKKLSTELIGKSEGDNPFFTHMGDFFHETDIIMIGIGIEEEKSSEEIEKFLMKLKGSIDASKTLENIFYGLMEDPILEDISSGKVCPTIRKGFKLVACTRE